MGNQCCQQQQITTYELDVSSKIRQQDFKLVEFPKDDIYLTQKLKDHNQQSFNNVKIFKHLNMDKYYSGQWKQGLPSGIGFLYRPNNYYYNGKFDMKPNNQGEIELIPSGLKYKGDIKDGKAEGKGILTHQNGVYYYEGTWKNSEPVTGTLVINSIQNNAGKKTVVFNEFPIGETHIQYPDGREYKGIINPKSLLPQGRGKVTYQDGSQYDGQWFDGQFHGEGVYKWRDGTYYEGNYQNGKKHGDGKYMYKSHNIYQGEWMEGVQHGIGALINQRGQVMKKGVWKYGKFLISSEQV